MMGCSRINPIKLILGWCFYVYKDLPSIISRFLVFTALVTTTAACTTAPLKNPHKSSFNKVLVDVADAPEVSVAIINKPGNQSDYIKPFKTYDLLVLALELKNTGRDLLLIDRADIMLIAPNGRSYSPISEKDALARATGPIGRLVPTVESGYYVYAIRDKILLRSGESTAGYLFYQVSENRYDDAAKGNLRFAFYRIKRGESTVYRLRLSDSIE